MTPEDFRKSPTLCAELKALTESRAFRIGCDAVLHQFIAMDAPTGSHPVVSARMLTERTSFERAYQQLALLPESALPLSPDQPEDWGEPEAAARLHGEDLPLPYQGPVQPEQT